MEKKFLKMYQGFRRNGLNGPHMVMREWTGLRPFPRAEVKRSPLSFPQQQLSMASQEAGMAIIRYRKLITYLFVQTSLPPPKQIMQLERALYAIQQYPNYGSVACSTSLRGHTVPRIALLLPCCCLIENSS